MEIEVGVYSYDYLFIQLSLLFLCGTISHEETERRGGLRTNTSK